MHVILWEYEPLPDRVQEFEQAYAADGVWAELFRRDPAYRGTELLRKSGGIRYSTIDRWDSAGSYQRFREQHAAEYQALDAACDRLTAGEWHLGSYDSL